jgi:putative ABC transport system permease protein
VLGRSVLLNGVPHTIVGVLSTKADTRLFGRSDVMVPQVLDAAGSARDERRLYLTARLKEGVTREQAAAELDAIAKQLRTLYPHTNARTGVVVRPLIELIGGETPFVLFLLALIAVLILAMACANTSNVILAQAASRQYERSLRAALGASRFDHVRLFMIESFVVSAAAGAVGLLLASWGIDGVRWLAGPDFGESSVNGTLLLVVTATSFVVPFAFALLPALRSSRPDPIHLNESSRLVSTGSGRRTRSLLVGVQVALAMVVTIQVVLVGRTAWNLRTAEYGFDPVRVMTFRMDLPEETFPDATQVTQFYTNLLARIEAIPGVISTAAINRLPIGDRELSARVTIGGLPPVADDERPFAAVATVTREYFRTLRVPLLRGRGLTEADFGRGPAVALVSEEVARRLWMGADPLGSHITLAGAPLPTTPVLVVGIVANARSSNLDPRVMPHVYVPSSWYAERAMTVLVRTDNADPRPSGTGDPRSSGPAQCERADLRRVVDGAGAVRGPVWNVHHRRPARRHRLHRLVSDGDGHLRRTLVLGCPAHAGDRCPNGAGRPSSSDPANGRPARSSADCSRRGGRSAGLARVSVPDDDVNQLRGRAGSARLRGRHRLNGADRVHSKLCSRAARDEGRSDRGVKMKAKNLSVRWASRRPFPRCTIHNGYPQS